MLLSFRQLFRLLYINRILVKHRLDEVVLATHLFRPFRFLLYLLPWNWLRGPAESRAVRIRRCLEDLGPIFVKFGQILSTRRDLLPDDIAAELSKLQDRVPPFSPQLASKIIENALEGKIEDLFLEFESTPLASASIAQVHAATLHDGRQVVIKVVRPDIEKTIRRDVSLLHIVAELAERYWPEGRRLRPKEVVSEYEKTIIDELDLMREAANASQLRRNFNNSDLLYIPEVYWPLTRRNVMVMERISGIPVNNVDELLSQGVDLGLLSERGVEIFFTQVFRHNFFHADMHPGNIFVAPNGQYIAVDFGIVGTLSPEDQHYLAENFIAFFNRDYNRVAELHVQSEWVPIGTRVDEFESAIRSVCEPIFERPLKDISFGHLLLRLFQTARRFNMVVQPQLVLLQKTLLNIEGLGRQLNPDLDLWKTAKPFLETWMQEQVGPRAFAKTVKKQAPNWAEQIPQIPSLAHDVLSKAQRGQLQLQVEARAFDTLKDEIRHSNNRTLNIIAAATFIIAATILYASDRDPFNGIFNVPLLTWFLGVIGVGLMIATWFKRH